MGNFSRDTFNRLNHYVGVRLQQGVPLVDADWNEMEDIKKYELQAYLKWFVGNGVPKGNDGFHILPAADSDNDFTIKGGDGTAEGAGRCLVEGCDVMNESNLRYTQQPLYNNAALAKTWGVAPLEPLNPLYETPNPPTVPDPRADTVYLDVWEREVDSEQDSHLVNPLIGIETCVRTKREWVVRVAEGAAAPPNPPSGHLFYPLASLKRPPGEGAILQEHIADLRLTGLSMLSIHDIQQIVKDSFGSSYSLDHDAQPNLKVSLREAINALLRGGLPSTPEIQLTSEIVYGHWYHTPKYFALEDKQGDIWVFWLTYGEEHGDIWYKRYDLANGSWTDATTLTTDVAEDYLPFAVVASSGDIWVFWVSSREGSEDICYKRYDLANGSWTIDARLTTDAGCDDSPFAVVASSGDIWVFWHSDRYGNDDIYYKRYDHITNRWDTNDSKLTDDSEYNFDPFAMVDNSGDIWVFWCSYREDNNNIYYRVYDYTNNSWDTSDYSLTYDASSDIDPFAVVDSSGDIWVFWVSYRNGDGDIYCKRRPHDSHYFGSTMQITTNPEYGDYNPSVILDGKGDLWLFWQSYRRGESNIYYKPYTPDTGWGREVQFTLSTGDDEHISLPFALADSQGDIWGFWAEEKYEYHVTIWYKKLIPAI